MENIFVRYYDLPCSIHSYVVSNSDDTYTVIINARLSRDTQLKAYQHECEHITNGDYERRCSADIIEIIAHKR